MFDNEILIPGEKVKRIRKMLHMTQEELAENICSKSNISLIEKNKQNISVNIAIKFAEKFNEIAKEKRIINLKLINKDDFIQDENFQANNIFKNTIINQLKGIESVDLFEELLSKAKNLIKTYNIRDDEKLELYKLSANFYYDKYNYYKSNKMCDIGLKICINAKNDFEEAYFYVFKSRNNIFTNNYIKALQQLDYAEDLNKYIGNNELYVEIFYHKGLAYKRLGDYCSALKYFEILNKFEINDHKMFLKIKMVYANCLTEQNKFEEAEKEYYEILDDNDQDFICLAYLNLSELHFNKKDYKSAAMYIKDSMIYNKNHEYIGDIFYWAGRILVHLDEDVEMYFLQALEACEKNDSENLDLIQKILYELVLIYIKRVDEENISFILRKSNELNINYCLIYAELVKYYRGRNEEKSNNLHDKLIDKLKQI